MRGVKVYSPYQFAVFRIIFGIYLAWHFVELLPYGSELFGGAGVLADPKLNFTFGAFPNPLWLWDSPAAVATLLGGGVVLALLFAAGISRRPVAVLLWFVWACLFHRNNLISNPGLPYVGLLLLLSATVPTGEPLRLRRSSGTGAQAATEWAMPKATYWTAWILLMVGYTYSGWVKLASPSWIDGTAFEHVLLNPLARDTALREFALGLPAVLLKLTAWGALAAELLALPLGIPRRTRPWIWLVLVGLHLGILSVVDFADLTLGMLMIHLFTFDPEWLPARRAQKGRQLVLYDGVCGLCDRTVQFLLEEDREQVLTFAALQSETGQATLERLEIPATMESLVFVPEHGSEGEAAYQHSTGVLRILSTVGGFWRVVSWLRVVPAPIRNAVYRFVAKYRYRWFGKFDVCKIPTPEQRTRFLD